MNHHYTGGTDYAGGVDYTGEECPPGLPAPSSAEWQRMSALVHAIDQRHAAIEAALRRKRFHLRIDEASKAGELPQILTGIDSIDEAAAGILPAATIVIQDEATTPLRITDLIVSSTNPNDLLLTRLDIGRLNLMASGTAIPSDAFVTGVQRPPIETPILPAGTRFAVGVNNIATANRRFNAMWVGIDLSDQYDVTRPR